MGKPKEKTLGTPGGTLVIINDGHDAHGGYPLGAIQADDF